MAFDLINVKGLKVYANHGVIPAENELGQWFVVDLEIATRFPERDTLSGTISYADLAALVDQEMRRTTFALIESVANHLASSILGLYRDRIHTVTVTVHKPSAPITLPFEDVSVTVTRAGDLG